MRRPPLRPPSGRARRRLLVGLVAVVVLAVVATLVWIGVDRWREAQRSDLERALAMAPADSQRYSWTDWAGVRREVGADLDASPSAAEVERLLDDAYELDLASTSALVESAPVLHAEFGFSPATAEWELFSQSAAGAVVMVRLGEDADFDHLAALLEELGYTPPAEEGGAWYGGEEVVARIGGVTPELQYVALDAERRLLLGSDTAGFLGDAVAAVAAGDGGAGDGGSGDGGAGGGVSEGVADVVGASGDPLAAVVLSGEQACTSLAMSQADDADQERGEGLVDEAGEVNPLTGFAMSVQPDLGVRVALGFESEAQARTNADTRALLAEGEAVGQGGDFADRFAVDSVTAEGRVVALDLDPVAGSYVLSDLSSGPVLFATC